MAFLLQFGGDIWSNILWLIILVIFFNFYPRIMVSQLLWKLEKSATMLEGLTTKAKNIVLKKLPKKSKEIREKVDNFLEFFMIEPVSLDPYGIIKKLEHISNLSEERFKVFVKDLAPGMDKEEQANLVMGLSGAISLNQLAKVVRHYVETVRKTKNLQLGMVLEMQLPMIERISKALFEGTEALTNGWPVGDSVGCMVAARLIGNSKVREMEEEDVVVAERKIKGKKVIIMKAKGPGGRLGKLGKAIEKLLKKRKVSKIITIDAAAKLEGEKTGKIAEGVGVAIGGIGVDRAYIENLATKKNIPLDSVVIKMSQEEAIQPIPEAVLKAVPLALQTVERIIENSKDTVLVVGVGNTCGVGNDGKAAEKAEIEAKKILKMLKKREEKEKKSFWDWI